MNSLTEYSAKLTAFYEPSNSSHSLEVKFLTHPLPVTNVAIESLSSSTVTLSWTESIGASIYVAQIYDQKYFFFESLLWFLKN